MGIRKQEFYEGAALHILARTGLVESIRYEVPFFTFNDRVLVLMKYSTKTRSPWGFTFTADEQALLRRRAAKTEPLISLICGADEIVAFSYAQFTRIAVAARAAVHIACYRDHGEHYEVSGPGGVLPHKISRSNWLRVLGFPGPTEDE